MSYDDWPQHNKIDQKVQQPKKEITLKLSLTRRKFVVLSAFLILFVAGIYLYSSGLAESWINRYRSAILVVGVQSTNPKGPVDDALVVIGGSSGKTNKTGQLTLENLVAGKKIIAISKNGFQKYQKEINLHRGVNSLTNLVLNKVPSKTYILKGKVINKITRDLIAGAKISIDKKEAVADDKGSFKVQEVVGGKSQLAITKDGFEKYEAEIEIPTQSPESTFEIYPEKIVYFVSNRDGKKGIYQSNLSGGKISQIVIKSDKGEENTLAVASDQKNAFLTSYRDGVEDENGNEVLEPFIINLVNKNFSKINADRSPNGAVWSSDSRFVVYQASRVEQNKRKNVLVSFDTKEGKLNTIWQGFGYIYDLELIGPDKILYVPSKNTDDDASVQEGLLLSKLDGTETKIILNDKPYNLQQDLSAGLVYFKVTRDNLKYSFDTDAEVVQEIKVIPNTVNEYIFSPNGRQMIYASARDGKTDIYLKSAQGGEEKKITTSGVVSSPAWLNDEYITFNQKKEGESALYVTSISGVSAVKVVDVTIVSQGAGFGY